MPSEPRRPISTNFATRPQLGIAAIIDENELQRFAQDPAFRVEIGHRQLGAGQMRLADPGAQIREIRVGLRPVSQDGLPILGPVSGIANLLLATGHGPVGLQLGPYSGKVVAETIIDGAAETDIGRFSLARFAPLR